MARRSKRLRKSSSSRHKLQWIEDPISKTTPPTYIGVCVEGQELYVGTCCHVRGGQGKNDEYTCELHQFYEDPNGEKIAKVRWFYWPAELHTKRKLKNLPSFSSKEVVLSDEYDIIDVETISKPCYIISVPSTAKVPVKASKGTLYCKWRINKESKELVPAIPTTAQPVRKQEERKQAGTTLPESAQPVKKQREGQKRKEVEATSPMSPQPVRKHRVEQTSKEDKTTSSKKRKTSSDVTIRTLKSTKHKITPPTKRQRAQPVHKEVEGTHMLQVARESVTGNPLDKYVDKPTLNTVPESLPCRQAEYDQIYSFVELRLQDHTGGCMYISGMPGTGKTATVLEVIHELQQCSVTKGGGDVPVFQFIHLNGLNLTNPQQVFQVILKQLTGKTASPATAVDKLNKHFSDMEPDSEGCILLLVDELDMLWTKKQSVFYTIFEWCTWPDTPLILVAIANTMDLPERMLIGRITSRLGLTRLEFLPYDFKQLLEILLARLQDLNVFEHDALVLAARKIAAMSGDARKALDVCRRATEVAEQQGCSRVGIRHIDAVVKEMFFSLKVMAVKYASLQEKLLLQSIQADLVRFSAEETTLEQVYSTYCNLSRAVKDAMQVLSLSELSSVSMRLADVQLLSLGKARGIHQMLRLNIGKDDLNYGLSL